MELSISEKSDTSGYYNLNVLQHLYPKDYGNNRKMKVRKEVQEYPNKPLEEAFMDKLKDDDDNGDKTFTEGL